MQQEMKYIYTVYQKGSFSKAAESLYMTQPALSISIQKVETEIGMPLFNRDKKPLELTEAGKLYIEKIRQIMHLENELAQQLGDLTSLKTGNLRVGGSHYFNSYILPPVIADFKKKWPGIDLQLTEAGSNELLDMLKEDLIDLTFNCTPDPHDKLRRVPGFKDTILLAVSTRFPVNDHLPPAIFFPTVIWKKIVRLSRWKHLLIPHLFYSLPETTCTAAPRFFFRKQALYLRLPCRFPSWSPLTTWRSPESELPSSATGWLLENTRKWCTTKLILRLHPVSLIL